MSETKFSRHVEIQYKIQEDLVSKLEENLVHTIHFQTSHDDHIERKITILSHNKKMTRETCSYLAGYSRALERKLIRSQYHVRRILGRPETATDAKWDGMSEEMKLACREHRTESCLSWDSTGQKLFSKWTQE